jgi:hypothetical protein
MDHAADKAAPPGGRGRRLAQVVQERPIARALIKLAEDLDRVASGAEAEGDTLGVDLAQMRRMKGNRGRISAWRAAN